nr:MAG TPA: hypothetical protein [Caudoviricetes sp.]
MRDRRDVVLAVFFVFPPKGTGRTSTEAGENG